MISIVQGLASVWRRDFGSETFWRERIGAAYAKAGPQALCEGLSGSKHAA